MVKIFIRLIIAKDCAVGIDKNDVEPNTPGLLETQRIFHANFTKFFFIAKFKMYARIPPNKFLKNIGIGQL